MSIEICRYHNGIGTSYQDTLKNGSIFAIKKEQDLTELAQNILISQENQEYVKSTTDLKDRNIFLIYNVLPGGGKSFFIKNINSNPSEIQVKVVGVSCSSIAGTCDMNAQFFIVSAPKTYEKENFAVSFDELDIYSEPEFEDYEDFLAIDKQIDKAFHTFDEDTQHLILHSYYNKKSVDSLSEETWFKSLTDNQKEIVRQFREAIISRDKKFEELGDKKYKQKMRENVSDRIQRYRKLCSRLEKPVIN